MKHYKYISGLLMLLVLQVLSSCGDFLDVNKDPNNPATVSEPLLLTGILANFSYEVVGGFPVRVTNSWIKQTTYNAVLPHYDNYQLTENDVNNLWTYYSYPQIMENCKVLAVQAEENKKSNYASIAKIIWAWNLGIVTDLYGDVPYTQAWQADKYPKPAYDDQQVVYEGIQSLLDQAIAGVDLTATAIKPGADDFIFAGNMQKWLRVAYTLKARFYMHLTYAPGYDKKVQAQLALDALANGMKALTDDAKHPYLNEPGQENPWFQYAIDGKWDKDTQVSNRYITLLTDLQDPRIHAQVGLVDGEYAGHENGEVAEPDLSPIGEFYSAADAPVEFISVVEAKFLAAEAYFLLGNRSAAESSLEAGLTLSFDKQKNAIISGAGELSITAPAITLQIQNYITANKVLPVDEKLAYQHIMTQKYIANFLQFETYNDWRRTGYPVTKKVNDPFATNITTVPLRFPYPSAELQYNSQNVNAEGLPIGFRALGSTVWWNSNQTSCAICGEKQ